jgi:hypothetical protein
MADIEVTMVDSHANLKVLSPRRPRQVIRLVAVLHLNVTSAALLLFVDPLRSLANLLLLVDPFRFNPSAEMQTIHLNPLAPMGWERIWNLKNHNSN